MADIELVIKISEDSFKATCNGCMLPPDVENIVQGIKNSTPLPKGHWIVGEKISDGYTCSNCGVWYKEYPISHKWCPQCGSDNREVEE